MGLLDGLFGEILGSAASGENQLAGNPLTSILGSLSGGNQSQSGNLLMAGLSLLQQHGGLPRVLEMFRGSGMAEQADSWVGTGANQNITSEQIQQVFGAPALGSMAAQLGVPGHQVGGMLAQLLPEIVNQLTPQGQVPENHSDLLTQALSMLGRR